MANEVKILVACGSGVATSTVAQEAVKKILADANIPGKILKGSMSEIPLKKLNTASIFIPPIYLILFSKNFMTFINDTLFNLAFIDS